MNLTLAQFLNKRLPRGAARLCRLISATLCLFLLTAVPALADPVSVNHVVQTLSNSQGTIDLRLKTLIAQDPATKGGTQQNGPRADGTQGQSGTKTESIISGVAITSEGQQLGVEYIEEGEVDGTICDCGEILVAGGAFPKWPFLFLGAVPLIFIDHDCDNCDQVNEPTPTPTPPSSSSPTPPPPPGVPEPASLLLFGTGLAVAGAGLRRRYAKTKTREEE